MNTTILNFVKHCLTDNEFMDAGGIPTKEKFYLKKLGWEIGSEELSRFYDAVYALRELIKGRR